MTCPTPLGGLRGIYLLSRHDSCPNPKESRLLSRPTQFQSELCIQSSVGLLGQSVGGLGSKSEPGISQLNLLLSLNIILSWMTKLWMSFQQCDTYKSCASLRILPAILRSIGFPLLL